MDKILNLERYPLHRPESDEWLDLVEKCRDDLLAEGMFNLPGF